MIFNFILQLLLAAPYPATSSSAVVSENAYMPTSWGFELIKNDQKWVRIVPNEKDPFHLALLRPEGHSQARLNIRVDPVAKRSEKVKVSLKSYTEHWIRQYPKLGIEILEHAYTKINGKPAARIDSYNTNNKMQIRQYVVWHNDNAVLFACADHRDNFVKSLYSCERVLRFVSWTSDSNSKNEVQK